MTTSLNLTTVSTANLVTFFNARAEKPVKRFADRATAEKRVLALIESLDAEFVEADGVLCEVVRVDPVSVDELTTAAKRSIAATLTWKRPEVAAKRVKRNAVMVDGVEFQSVRTAFAFLGLPDSKHIAFRLILKANKVATFTFGNISKTFELIEETEE